MNLCNWYFLRRNDVLYNSNIKLIRWVYVALDISWNASMLNLSIAYYMLLSLFSQSSTIKDAVKLMRMIFFPLLVVIFGFFIICHAASSQVPLVKVREFKKNLKFIVIEMRSILLLI